jgi:hypothetical protein
MTMFFARSDAPHPALRATLSRRERGVHNNPLSLRERVAEGRVRGVHSRKGSQ